MIRTDNPDVQAVMGEMPPDDAAEFLQRLSPWVGLAQMSLAEINALLKPQESAP